jgi:glutaredoxin 2
VKVDRTLVIPLLRGLTRTLGIPWSKRCAIRTLADRRGIRLLSVNIGVTRFFL